MANGLKTEETPRFKTLTGISFTLDKYANATIINRGTYNASAEKYEGSAATITNELGEIYSLDVYESIDLGFAGVKDWTALVINATGTVVKIVYH